MVQEVEHASDDEEVQENELEEEEGTGGLPLIVV